MNTTKNTSKETVQPYLFFEGRCEEALEFYRKTLGAEVTMMMRFKDTPESPDPSGGCGGAMPAGDKVMHADFRIGTSTLMASDGNCGGKQSFQGISLSYSAATEAEADKAFAALAEGGEIQMPMMKTFFSPRFGMVADKFGVSWMVIVPPKA